MILRLGLFSFYSTPMVSIAALLQGVCIQTSTAPAPTQSFLQSFYITRKRNTVKDLY